MRNSGPDADFRVLCRFARDNSFPIAVSPARPRPRNLGNLGPDPEFRILHHARSLSAACVMKDAELELRFSSSVRIRSSSSVSCVTREAAPRRPECRIPSEPTAAERGGEVPGARRRRRSRAVKAPARPGVWVGGSGFERAPSGVYVRSLDLRIGVSKRGRAPARGTTMT